jgi:hypothetical protein
MFQQLDIDKVSSTIETLMLRIRQRFPIAGLHNIASELHEIALDSVATSKSIAKPQIWLRLAIGLLIAAGTTIFVYGISEIKVNQTTFQVGELVQITEAALNAAVLIGAAIFFLVTIENRIKRQRALAALHGLRSIAHVIDMHQLTKDPAGPGGASPTPASPKRELTLFELNRYLDYCAELLSLTGKLAAIFGQSLNDREVIASANEIEQLTTNLSRKVWQKISNLPHKTD